ncbi:MAG: choice-of-anchor X domain-containing protein [Myxococcota bacterium]
MTRTVGAALAIFAGGAAYAQEHRGVLVRLQSGEALDGAVVAVFTPIEGAPTEVPMADDGQAPDVQAGDGIYAGAFSAAGDAFDVTLKVGDRAVSGGRVSWAPTDEMRELEIRLDGEAMAMTAGVAKPPEGGAAGAAPPTGAPAGGVAGGAPPGGALADRAVAPGKSDDGALFVQLGLGLLALVAAGWAWTRLAPRGPARRLTPPGVTRLPARGLAGEGTPSISEGVTAWVAAEPGALLEPLLATLADRHRVLVVAPADTPLPSVPGGPVYRLAADSVASVASAAAIMSRSASRPLAVLVVAGGDASGWAGLRERLPDGVGAVLLCAEAPEGVPAVHAVPDGDAWLLRSGEATVRARAGRRGLGSRAAG